jgi:hypothetical protein
MVSVGPSMASGGAMTLTREPSSRRASQIGLAFIDAAADLAHDALADVHQLRVVAEADIGRSILPPTSMKVVSAPLTMMSAMSSRASKRLQRAIAEHVVADVLEQVFLLGDRHHDVLDTDDLDDDVADFLRARSRCRAGELRQIDRVDQRVEDRLASSGVAVITT